MYHHHRRTQVTDRRRINRSWLVAKTGTPYSLRTSELYEDTDHGPGTLCRLDSPFRCDLPKRALGYSASFAPYHLHGHWGSAGFNSVGVGMSATESIFSSDRALEADPLVVDGVAENSVFNIVLPYIHTARVVSNA